MTDQIDKLIVDWKRQESEPFSGWDFSHLEGRVIDRDSEDRAPVESYESMVCDLMKISESVLDLGTGGGERLAELHDVFPTHVTATEGYEPNYLLAKKRLEPIGVRVVYSEDSIEQALPFNDNEFDLVINRHTAFNITEVDRVLKPNGVFLTQQVDGSDLKGLYDAFEVDQQWPWWHLEFVLDQLKMTRLVPKVSISWSYPTIFKDVGAVVYFLKAIPWIVPDFSVESHLSYLLKLQKQLEQEGELVFYAKRILVKAVKPN